MNWLEEFEQECDLIQPFRTVYEVYKEAMDTYIFQGKKTTKVKAVSYIQACGKFVDKLAEKSVVEIDHGPDGYIFIDNLKNELIPVILETEAHEKEHACALYIKSLTDRGLMIRADKDG